MLPFGCSQSPAFFCEMTEAAASIFRRLFVQHGLQVQCFVYVDDFLFIAEDHIFLKKAFDLVNAEASFVGFGV